jgi:hypothetical protein
VLATGAAVLISICFYLNSWGGAASGQTGLSVKGLHTPLYPSRFAFLMNWLGLLMLAGAIIYGFKIARQAIIDARKNVELLEETKQRTMEIAALYVTLQDVSEKQELRTLLLTILERARTLLAASGCAIFLFDPDHNDFQIAVKGVGMIGAFYPAAKGLRDAWLTLEPVMQRCRQPYRRALKQLPIRAPVCVPMIREGGSSPGSHEFGEMHREFTEADACLSLLR